METPKQLHIRLTVKKQNQDLTMSSEEKEKNLKIDLLLALLEEKGGHLQDVNWSSVADRLESSSLLMNAGLAKARCEMWFPKLYYASAPPKKRVLEPGETHTEDVGNGYVSVDVGKSEEEQHPEDDEYTLVGKTPGNEVLMSGVAKSKVDAKQESDGSQ